MNQKTAHLTQREKKLRHQKAMRLKKIRRIKRIIKTGSVCLVIVFAVCLFRNITSPEGKAGNKPAAISANVEDAGFQNTSSSVSVVGNIQGEYVDDLKAMVSDYPEISSLIEHYKEYPEPLFKILTKNPETLNFVLDYPSKKDTPAATTIGPVTKGTIPLLLQWDERWGYAPYGSSMVAVSGCGPTCIAMVASGLTGRDDLTPAAVAAYSEENGYLTQSLDTSWDLMTSGAEGLGITGTMLGLDENAMINTLNNGYPIICSVGPGDFTSNGHFIVLTGYEDGGFTVNDPNSKIRSSKTWSFDRLKDQISNMWYYTEL